ncbi:CinA family protein [Microbacterium sp. SSW1-59]|uniref:CinA family protein n=1 Tax=Microbacterium xanthum TaxID=3079794 RepID=UPI002AD48E9C|nr:CinA family protein [Microbacterium sp. SSW1-59]MDZ8201810.1 CinA family protein [Microbacterium sp. SSW1-59]
MSEESELLDALRGRGWTIACAESLTGGLVCAQLTAVPGASAVVRGGVVAYATDLKADMLGVASELLAERGPVDAEVAVAMADGVRGALGAEVGIATTGVAGPEPQGSAPVGRVFIAAAGPHGRRTEKLDLDGTREDIRRETVRQAIALARGLVRPEK